MSRIEPPPSAVTLPSRQTPTQSMLRRPAASAAVIASTTIATMYKARSNMARALPREGRRRWTQDRRRSATLITAAAIFRERLRAPRRLSSRGKAQRRARFAHESRFDRADVPIDELDDAALVDR